MYDMSISLNRALVFELWIGFNLVARLTILRKLVKFLDIRETVQPQSRTKTSLRIWCVDHSCDNRSSTVVQELHPCGCTGFRTVSPLLLSGPVLPWTKSLLGRLYSLCALGTGQGTGQPAAPAPQVAPPALLLANKFLLKEEVLVHKTCNPETLLVTETPGWRRLGDMSLKYVFRRAMTISTKEAPPIRQGWGPALRLEDEIHERRGSFRMEAAACGPVA